MGFAGIILFLEAFSGHLRVFTEVCDTWPSVCFRNMVSSVHCPYFLLQIKKDFRNVFWIFVNIYFSTALKKDAPHYINLSMHSCMQTGTLVENVFSICRVNSLVPMFFRISAKKELNRIQCAC